MRKCITKFSQEEILDLDKNSLAFFNSNPKRKKEHLLKTRTGAFLPTKNISYAPVVLLLANPGYSEDRGICPDGCEAYESPDWPFGHICPDAPSGSRDWTLNRMKHLLKEFNQQFLSQSIACAQLTPWASENFHGNEKLPSRDLILEAVKQAADRGALILVMRAVKLWLPAIDSAKDKTNVLYTRAPRCSYISPDNVIGYESVIQCLQQHRDAPQGVVSRRQL